MSYYDIFRNSLHFQYFYVNNLLLFLIFFRYAFLCFRFSSSESRVNGKSFLYTPQTFAMPKRHLQQMQMRTIRDIMPPIISASSPFFPKVITVLISLVLYTSKGVSNVRIFPFCIKPISPYSPIVVVAVGRIPNRTPKSSLFIFIIKTNIPMSSCT